MLTISVHKRLNATIHGNGQYSGQSQGVIYLDVEPEQVPVYIESG
jgi:hypothetical protein